MNLGNAILGLKKW